MVTKKSKKRWQKRIFEDYIAINYLLDFAYVDLADDELDLWAINLETENYSVYMEIKFWEFCKKILVLDVWTKKEEDYKQLKDFVRSSFKLSLDIYSFLLEFKSVWENHYRHRIFVWDLNIVSKELWYHWTKASKRTSVDFLI